MIDCLTCGEEASLPTKIRDMEIPLCLKCRDLLEDMGEPGFIKYFRVFLKKYASKRIKLDPISGDD